MHWLVDYVKWCFHDGVTLGGVVLLVVSVCAAGIAALLVLMAMLQTLGKVRRGTSALGRSFAEGWRDGGPSSR